MSSPSVQQAGSLKEFVELVEASLAGAPGPRWFRGAGSSTYTLTPGLYRDDIAEPVEAEYFLMEQFSLRSRPYHTLGLGDHWELLFLMQHHRLPTRLLDWTESPFVALYFALESAERNGFSEDSAVWSLDPAGSNEATQEGRNPQRQVLTVEHARLKFYAPPIDVEQVPEPPLAIYAPHNNPRIVAQGGTFTIFGKGEAPLEQIHSGSSYAEEVLSKIVISSGAGESMLENLVRLGYTHSRIFPDLDGLAQELTRNIKGAK